MFDAVIFIGMKQTIPAVTLNSEVDEMDYDASLGVKDVRSYNEFVMNGHMDEFKYYYRVLTDTGKYTTISNLVSPKSRDWVTVLVKTYLSTVSAYLLQTSGENLSDMTLTLA